MNKLALNAAVADELEWARQMSRGRTPRIVACLAYAGLIPFLALLAASWLDTQRSGVWQQLSLHYGAVILSFVGALHWGFAMSVQFVSDRKRNVCFAWSVIPALLAWLALRLTRLRAVPCWPPALASITSRTGGYSGMPGYPSGICR